MAVVQSPAIRRRQGIAPNALVMAEGGSPEGEQPYTVGCRVGRCKESFQSDSDPAGVHAVTKMRIHEMTTHPRHPAGVQSRQVMKDYFERGPR